MFGLENEVAIVTGGARGIGEAIVREFLAAGCYVVIADIDEEAVRTLADSINMPERTMPVRIDVSSHEETHSMVEKTVERFGSVSILVNNAGIQTDAEVEVMPEEMWDETISINLKGVFNCSKAVIPHMRKQGYGRIINISSMSAHRGSFRHAHYCAAKAGVLGFTRALALELGKYQITVNAVSPGIVETRMPQRTMQWKREIWLTEIPLKRFGQPEDISAMVCFLASKRAAWITGQSFEVNGGIIMP